MASRGDRRYAGKSGSSSSSQRSRGSGRYSSRGGASSSSSKKQTDFDTLRKQVEQVSAMTSVLSGGGGKILKSPSPVVVEPTINCEYLGIIGMTHSQAKDLFGNTKIVLLCGPSTRAHKLANMMQTLHLKTATVDQIGNDDYFTLIKVGPVLVCSHGMGASSALICLNEIWSLLRVALPSKVRSTSLCVIRVGSSGGIGVEAGTLVLSTEVLNNETLRPEWLYFNCGQRVSQPCRIDIDCTDQLYYIAKSKGVPAEQGKSMATDDYYESQARLDGSLCEFDRADQSRHMKALFQRGVRNIEMEGTVISGFCTKHQIPFAMIAVAYLDRLKAQTVSAEYTKEELDSWMDRALKVVVAFAAKHVAKCLKMTQD